VNEKRFAQDLRANPTDVEKLLWWKLRARQFGGWKFRRQVPIIGFVADFACLEACLVIELDGGQHAEAADYDEGRSAALKKAGFRVLRFWNIDVIENLEGVLTTIERTLGAPLPRPETPSPQPSPRRGEGVKATQS
jgi:very-short-patch-repair endonuclease